jgi:hypothetical protein
MPADSHAHRMLDQLGPVQIEAVVKVMEAMLDPEDEELTAEDIAAIAASREYFRNHPEGGVTFEQFAAECGFTMDQILDRHD